MEGKQVLYKSKKRSDSENLKISPWSLRHRLGFKPGSSWLLTYLNMPYIQSKYRKQETRYRSGLQKK